MCERIPYLILPVRQLSRQPFGKHRMRRTIHRTRPMRASRRARSWARLEPSAEAPRASRRARRWARLEPSAEAIYEQAVWQAAAPVSKHAPPREPARTPCHPPSDLSSKTLPRSCVRSGAQVAASGRRRYGTEPLRLFAVNPLTVGELGRRVIGEVILV